LLSSIPYLSVFRFGRIVRIIRIFRLLRTVRASKALVPHIVKLGAKNTALAVALSTGLFIVVSIIAMLNFETTPASNITTIMDAVWWGFGTVTMEGSDKYPVTVEGKIVAIMLMIMGIVCFSIFTSYITNAFTNMTNKNNEDSVDSLKKQLSRLEAQLESIQTQLSDFVPASRPEAIGQRDDLN